LYNLVFYTAERGDSPLDDFLDGLDKKSRAKVAAYMSLLEEEGQNLKRPYADIVRGKIVLVHAFSKKTRQLKKKDIDLAEKRMEDWIERFPAGGEI